MFNYRLILCAGLFFLISGSMVNAQTYTFYVAAESDDKVYQISFNANTQTSTIENITEVGMYPTEIEGPHGLGVDPTGDYWFVSLGHGMPYGHLYKYETGTDRVIGRVELGLFPATLDISAETGWVYIVNFDLHGPHEPSSLSIVDGRSMEEIERIETGIMPHGSRLTPDGAYQYHVSMMTDELFEIDAFNLTVSRKLNLHHGESSPAEMDHSTMDHSGHQANGHSPDVKPTWASPHPTKPYVYVAGNGNDKIYTINTNNWEVSDVWETSGKAPYNLEPTHDGEYLVVTYKGEGATGIWDIETGRELAKIPNSRKVTHGVTISPDNRFAFVSVEGIGGQPGSVDIFDIGNQTLVDVIEIGKQASGIAFWKRSD